MQGKAGIVTCLFIFALGFGVRCAHAEEGSGGGGWEVRVVPYLWLTGMDAEVAVTGAEGLVEVSFGDLWKVEEYGGSVYLEAGKGRWALIADGIYIQEDFDSEPPDRAAVADVERLTGELAVAYHPSFLGALELVAGALVTDLNIEVSVEGGPAASIDDTWLDPFLGLRVRKRAGESVTFMLRTDVGGFRVNDALGVRFIAEGNLDLTERLYFLTAFRFGYLDYDGDELDAELKHNGVALGIGCNF